MGLIAVFLDLICPTLGAIMATCMFGAPIVDLRRALLKGKLGDLNPFPWAMMTGNCLGWVVYGYYKNRDPFLVAANLPGLILSLWLNSGAAKLQYQEHMELKHINSRRETPQEDCDASSPLDEGDNDGEMPVYIHRDGGGSEEIGEAMRHHPENLVTVPQERALLRVLIFWAIVIVWAGWVDPRNAAETVGLVVNLNLIFFYGAPLQAIRKVMSERNSASIHRPTMFMNWTNTTFWILYGIAKLDPVIIFPNSVGLTLGLAQGLLCLCYPNTGATHEQVPLEVDDE